jgi:hypothetical protein
MFVALSIQYATRMRHIVICGSLYNIFPHYLISGKILEEKKLNIKCVSYLSTILSETFLIIRRN